MVSTGLLTTKWAFVFVKALRLWDWFLLQLSLSYPDGFRNLRVLASCWLRIPLIRRHKLYIKRCLFLLLPFSWFWLKWQPARLFHVIYAGGRPGDDYLLCNKHTICYRCYTVLPRSDLQGWRAWFSDAGLTVDRQPSTISPVWELHLWKSVNQHKVIHLSWGQWRYRGLVAPFQLGMTLNFGNIKR